MLNPSRSLAAFTLALALGQTSSIMAQAQQPSSHSRAMMQTTHKQYTGVPGNLGVPLPPNAKFVTGYEAKYTTSQRITAFIRVTSEQTPTNLISWYENSLRAMSWEVKPRKTPKGTMLMCNKESQSAMVNIVHGQTAQDPTTIMLTIER